MAQYLHDTIQNKPNFEIVLENVRIINFIFNFKHITKNKIS